MGHRVSVVVSFVSLAYLSLYACNFIALIVKFDPCCAEFFGNGRKKSEEQQESGYI